MRRGRDARNSEEAVVMTTERRGDIDQLKETSQLRKQEEQVESSKQYQIDRRKLYLAYRKVKTNKGSPSLDGIGFEDYEKNL